MKSKIRAILAVKSNMRFQIRGNFLPLESDTTPDMNIIITDRSVSIILQFLRKIIWQNYVFIHPISIKPVKVAHNYFYLIFCSVVINITDYIFEHMLLSDIRTKGHGVQEHHWLQNYPFFQKFTQHYLVLEKHILKD